ncbi:MAG: hypothetical protein WBM99_13935 [Psychromonas sp.]
MSTVIRLPAKIYKRLERHSIGFETPAQVIEKLLDHYEADASQAPYQHDSIDMELLEQAFERIFKVKPRKFGQKSHPISGYSDDAKGVQWNIGLISSTGNIKLGINLEGMSYSNTWPISNFIQKELITGDIIKYFGNEEDITVRFVRDAWQVSSRLPIEEQTILKAKLNVVTPSQWKESLEVGLSCLNEDKDYKGRTIQDVTLKASGRIVEREVSPHISFKLKITPEQPTLDSLCKAIENGRERLLSLYEHVNNSSL